MIAVLAVAGAALAAPAQAKPPLLSHPTNCETVVHESAHVRTVCARSTTSAVPRASPAGEPGGLDPADAWLVAAGAATAVLAIAGARLAVAHHHGVHSGRPAPQG
jgi:hypothetical protein